MKRIYAMESVDRWMERKNKKEKERMNHGKNEENGMERKQNTKKVTTSNNQISSEMSTRKIDNTFR